METKLLFRFVDSSADIDDNGQNFVVFYNPPRKQQTSGLKEAHFRTVGAECFTETVLKC